jgi:ATP-dependent Lhr-like helicase
MLLPDPGAEDLSSLAERVFKALEGRGALFFRQISDEVGSIDDADLVAAVWELVWAGLVTNDTLAPLRATTGGAARAVRARGRRGRSPAFPSRLGPPSAAGRWSALPSRESSGTRRSYALAEQLLARHGIVTGAAVAAERIHGGFASIYPVLKAMEESGRCRRGYFVEGLGGAQFALVGAVDRMRSFLDDPEDPNAVVLAAADPANQYGAALKWPERPVEGHRPGRKAGANVVLVGGRLVAYLEAGGRSMLTFTDDEGEVCRAVDEVGEAARRGSLGSLHIERVDGEPVLGSSVGELLSAAGGRLSSRGLRFKPGRDA